MSIKSPKDYLQQDPCHALALQFGMKIYPTLAGHRLPKEYYKRVPYAFVKKHLVLPIGEENGAIIVAVADPLHLEPLEELRIMLERGIEAVYCPKGEIVSQIHDCYDKELGAASQMISDLQDAAEDTKGEEEIYDLLDESADQAPVVKFINLILTEAIQQGASDIHFEPCEEGLKVRYRIDGVLQGRHAPGVEVQSQLLTRIKVMAKLDIAERRRPQDGRIKLRLGSREIDFRVSTVPIVNGERIVLRILDKGNIVVGLDKIGLPEALRRELRRQINVPEGIVLVTGPTGSGKTTTLYSAICEMDRDDCNIMTIEDPVEYKLKGIAQIGVQPKIGLDFAAGLRHILRQDPDVIMIGEIRDKETAQIAIQAALTGHLVLTTLHTNDAPSAITRLVDMGIEPYLLSSCLVGILAQRLVRTICSSCKQTYRPVDVREEESEFIDQVAVDGYLYRGEGCPHCFGTGYRGRHGVYELMTITNGIQKQIVKSPDAVELRNLAVAGGMTSLRNHGADLIRMGITTVTEVLRVTRG